MTLSKKTKPQLIAEVKKLQQKLDLAQKNKKSHLPQTTLKDPKWESFFKNSLNIIAIVDRRGNILEINKVAERSKVENLVGKSAYKFVSKDAAKAMKAAIEKVFATKVSQDYTRGE